MATLQVILGQLVPPHFSSSTCSWKEPLGINGTGFLWAACPSAWKHWRKHKSVKPTSGLASSFLHPPPDSWWKERCFLHPSSPAPVPNPITTITVTYAAGFGTSVSDSSAAEKNLSSPVFVCTAWTCHRETKRVRQHFKHLHEVHRLKTQHIITNSAVNQTNS